MYDILATGSARFWNEMKGLGTAAGVLSEDSNVRVVMTASYGIFLSTATEATPLSLPLQCVINLRPSSHCNLALQLTREEYEDVWQLYGRETGLRLGDSISAYLASICDRQVCNAGLAPVAVLTRMHQTFHALRATVLNSVICHAAWPPERLLGVPPT